MINCPKCHLSMRSEEYEGTNVLFCDTCWGYWLDDSSLAQVLASEDYGFSQGERDTVFQSWVRADVGMNNEPHGANGKRCPVCQSEMTESAFANDCPVLVDRCSAHGTWLDSGEIKQLQVFVEQRKK